ncbi:MAG: tetratricopeptide repeat protein [Acidobacteria bacterium]|nr:tetratricopeptide repeat protein [Acidobacteriota bacterium]
MSLIVDALKRAQESATRRVPPLAGQSARGPLPGLTVPSAAGGRARRFVLVALAIGAVAAIGVVVVQFAGGVFPRSVPKPPQVLVVQPAGQSSSTTPKPAAEAGTSIEEVRAALLAAQPLETTATPVETPPAAKVRTPPPPQASSGRVAGPPGLPQRVEVDAQPAPPAAPPAAGPESPLPSAGPRPPAAAREAPAIVKVHPEPAKEAGEALAAGLREQQAGQGAKAIDEYRRGIRIDARNPGLFNNLGVALRESGHLDEAIEAFQSALNIDPKYEKALNNLGVSRYQQGQYAAAIELFNQALRVNPANVESAINIGMIYFLAQRWDEALSAFQQALRSDSKSAEAHYNLGLFWERRGDRERAVQEYRKFVEFAGPQHAPLAARVTEHLRQMERGK